MTSVSGPSRKTAEIVVALLMALFGAIVVTGSARVGVGWGPDGPQSGFFPFYVGLVILLGSAFNLLAALRLTSERRFAGWDQLGMVLSVVVPTGVYVAAVVWIGLYVSSFVLIAGFMLYFGRYSIALSTSLAAGVIVVTYVTFERWFLVVTPTRKCPL
jgi:hypothetical protein